MRLSFYMYFRCIFNVISLDALPNQNEEINSQWNEMNGKKNTETETSWFSSILHLWLWSIELFDRFACFARIKMCNFIAVAFFFRAQFSFAFGWKNSSLGQLCVLRWMVWWICDYFAHELWTYAKWCWSFQRNVWARLCGRGSQLYC